MTKKLLLTLLTLLTLSPAWAMQREDDEGGGGPGVAAILPDVPEILWSEIQHAVRDENLIGRGSYGNVYGGSWRGQDVAVKVLQLTTLDTDDIRHAFEREITTMWECQFPRVVRLYGVCREPGHYAMILERMRESLYRRLRASEIPESQRLQIALDIAQGLKNLHERPVLHRDLKSENILLDDRGRAKISDFGSAKIRTATATQTGVRGTIRWCAPEVLDVEHPRTTAASDMYSYGMILWELYARRIPFATQQNDMAVGTRVLNGAQEVIPPTCPPIWREVIEACWQQDPRARPTAQAVLARFMALKPPVRPLWLPEEEPGPNHPLRAEGYACYPASRGDWEKVLRCYQHHPVPGYDVGRVEVIFNPDMNARFKSQQKLLQQRQGNPRYLARWREEPHGDRRAEGLTLLENAAQPYFDDEFPDVKLVPVWHGTQRENLPSLLSAGYGAFCDTDGGYFGPGIYTTLEAEYAQMYADQFAPMVMENGVLILNLGITYSSFPIIRQDFNVDQR